METKFLNLDEINPEKRVAIRLNGQEHEMTEMSVGDFIWAQSEMEALKEIEDDTTVSLELMRKTVETVQRRFPTVPEKELFDLGFTKLRALIDFSQKSAVGVDEDGEAAEPGKAETSEKEVASE